MKRAFWVAIGLGAGVATAVMVRRWMRRQAERYSPANIGANLSTGAKDLGQLFREALEEGRRAMAEKEAEMRAGVGESQPQP